jgi:SAM-dependent methyltransferase
VPLNRLEAVSQRELNDRLWISGDRVSDYANRTLRPVEVLLLARYRDALAGRVLELGCGAGRLTGYLTQLSDRVEGLDVSQEMVDYCRTRYPRGHFDTGDLRDLSGYATGSLDVVAAPYNVIDVLSEEERLVLLGDLHRMLAPDGLLIVSSHNRGHGPRRRKPTDVRRGDPVKLAADVVRLPRRVRNSRRARRFERDEGHYAVLNDVSHDYRALHYYIARDDQERQLRDHGFELLEALDLDGDPVEPGGQAPDCPELHYVARRAG